MRKIDKVIIHCSDTWRGFPLLPQHLGQWHKERGFAPAGKCLTEGVDPAVGYHFYINRDGIESPLRPLEEAGIHCKGHNHNSIGICMEGGGLYEAKHKLQRNLKEYREKIGIKTIYQTVIRTAFLLDQFGLDSSNVFGHGELQLNKKDTCPYLDMNAFRVMVKVFLENLRRSKND